MRFLQSLPSDQKSRLKTLAIKDTSGWARVDVTPLFDFCRAHPTVHIRWYDTKDVYEGEDVEHLLASVFFYEFALGKRLPDLVTLNAWAIQR